MKFFKTEYRGNCEVQDSEKQGNDDIRQRRLVRLAFVPVCAFVVLVRRSEANSLVLLDGISLLRRLKCCKKRGCTDATLGPVDVLLEAIWIQAKNNNSSLIIMYGPDQIVGG